MQKVITWYCQNPDVSWSHNHIEMTKRPSVLLNNLGGLFVMPVYFLFLSAARAFFL